MTVAQVTAEEFKKLFGGSHANYSVYNSVEFAELNRQRADEVIYLTLADSKLRGGIILGRTGNRFSSPFSAPYGGLLTVKEPGISSVSEMWSTVAGFVARRSAEAELRITLPPVFMAPGLVAKSVNVLTGMGAISTVELNHHYDLALRPDIHAAFDVKTRNQLHQAQRLPYLFSELAPTQENIRRVYDVITRNHTHRGYPVNMTFDAVCRTAPVVGARFFMLMLDGVDVAAAQVHNPALGVAQIIYWGDVPGYSAARPMNLLAYRLFELYRDEGYGIVDIGISTVNGVPNPGLCDFKEGLGCIPTDKYTFLLR